MMKISYITSHDYLNICDKHTKVPQRASIVHGLIDAYGLTEALHIISPKVASKNELLKFHSEEYINLLQLVSSRDFDESENEERLEEFGLTYDCSVFPEIYDYVRYVTGATLTAAQQLIDKSCDIALNLNGGWHHACVDEASGFCYVNDVVIGILELMTSFKRILYIDLDCHHGDAVEQAFHFSKKVLTFSIHKYESGFFPGTGGFSNRHELNMAMKDGLRDDKFIYAFQSVYGEIINHFQPDVIVCQCGADGIASDPLGGFSLTEKSIPKCISEITRSNLPLLILGGGGYNIPNTARCWASLVGGLLDKELPIDIPDHRFLDRYKPDYSLNVSPTNRKDENSQTHVSHVINDVINTLKSISLKKTDVESSSLSPMKHVGVKRALGTSLSDK